MLETEHFVIKFDRGQDDLLARRDVIVRLFEQKGESALYDAAGRE